MTGRSAVQNTAKRHSKFETLSSCYGDFPFLSVRRPQANKLVVEKPLCHRRVGDVLFQHHFATCFVEVLTLFEIKIFGDVTPFLLINAVWLNFAEERNLHQHCCDNLRSRKVHLLVYGKLRFTLRATLSCKSRLFTSWRRIWSWHTHTRARKFICKGASFFTPTFSRNGRQNTVRRYSNRRRASFRTFQFNVLQLMLGFCSHT